MDLTDWAKSPLWEVMFAKLAVKKTKQHNQYLHLNSTGKRNPILALETRGHRVEPFNFRNFFSEHSSATIVRHYFCGGGIKRIGNDI